MCAEKRPESWKCDFEQQQLSSGTVCSLAALCIMYRSVGHFLRGHFPQKPNHKPNINPTTNPTLTLLTSLLTLTLTE